ncbi:MAG: hypothetical protein HYZ28_08000 [Myxococcales bacterium]|nr:hypothetical protein [Myxococcales bacterium]
MPTETDDARLLRAQRVLSEMERVLRLHQSELPRTEMARALGMPRRTLYRRLEALQLVRRRRARES